jgi:hypothetical protein
MLQFLPKMSGIDADIQQYDITEFHLNQNNNYVVHTSKPGGSNVYTNIGRDHLEQLLEKRGQNDQLALLRKIPKQEATPEHMSLEEALQNGFQITSYKIRNPTDIDHFVVHVEKGDMSKPYTNIKRDHLAKVLGCQESEIQDEQNLSGTASSKGITTTSEGEQESGTKRQGTGFPHHFQEAMDNGFEIVEYSQHENNPNYTVSVRQGSNEKKFTNIKAENLSRYMDLEPTKLSSLKRSESSSPRRAAQQSSQKSSSDPGALKSCAEKGGKVAQVKKVLLVHVD